MDLGLETKRPRPMCVYVRTCMCMRVYVLYLVSEGSNSIYRLETLNQCDDRLAISRGKLKMMLERVLISGQKYSLGIEGRSAFGNMLSDYHRLSKYASMLDVMRWSSISVISK